MDTPSVPTPFAPAFAGPFQTRVLVALADQRGFMRRARGVPPEALFADLDAFYRLVEDAVAEAGGLVIKFMGDAALIAFPEERSDTGIMALLRLKESADAWLQRDGRDGSLHVNVHFGEVMMGAMGRRGDLDIIGETVNVCATLPHRGFTLSQQAFRRLSPANRQLFHRFTPPITYHPAGA